MASTRPTTSASTSRCLTVALIVLVAPACARRLPAAKPDQKTQARVIHVVDGDTLDLDFGHGNTERVRLLGIDTPETVKPDSPVECFGPEASARTKELLPEDSPVIVERDREPRDRYGRLLVYLWRTEDRLFINDSLVRDGFASTLFIGPNTAARSTLSQAQAEARSLQRGLWGSCPLPG